MKRVLVRSVYDAFDYVMEHYYPAGMEEFAARTDHYAVISIQDTHTRGFGFQFTESGSCDDVLTLYFDDIEQEVEGAKLFSEEQAAEIIGFIRKNKSTESLLVHCYGGESRSRAVGAFAMEMLGGSSKKLFETGHPNLHVYHTLKNIYKDSASGGQRGMDIRAELFALQDPAYGDFQSKLIPGLPRESLIGVRVPELRKLARRMMQGPEAERFLCELPHRYYEENILHGILLSEIPDYGTCIDAVERFLPYVDNWAVCDVMAPKAFRRPDTDLPERIRTWAASEQTYTCRFGAVMLLTYLLNAGFRPEYLEIPASVHSGDYYVRMGIAWCFAEALAKQWDAAIPYLEEHRLDLWVHNKTIQKARESFRITPEQKAYLKTLKR